MSNRKGCRGYIGSRRYHGDRAPQHVQNLVIRDYCQRKGMTYLLSATEYAMPGCYAILEDVVREAPTLDSVVLYSIFMLPQRSARRLELCRRVLEAGATIHGAVENFSISNEADLLKLDELLLLSDVAEKSRALCDNAHAPGFRCDLPMPEVDFLSAYQRRTARNYIQRVTDFDKAACAAVAKQWGRDYWDGDRRYGYGGYSYDGRWLPIARDIVRHYGLKRGDRILDIGCGKAFLLYELTQAVAGIEVAGIDISGYALANAKDEVRGFLQEGNANNLPYSDASFDLVISINTFHNLRAPDLQRAAKEMERVGRGRKWLCVESYRNEVEKANLLYWQLTCRSFYDTEEWAWLLAEWGYRGDYGFIVFE